MSIEIENLLLIMVVVWTVGMLFRAMNLPLLLGELLAGLIFGPALLGVFHETESVKILAELGIFFLMLHAGLETEPKKLMHSSKLGLSVSIGALVLPLALGYGISLAFGSNQLEALFIGICMSITAVAVTSKMFKDLKYKNHSIKNLVMVAAVGEDIMAFVLATVVLTVASNGAVTAGELGFLILKIFLFFGAILFIGEKMLKHVLNKFFNETGGKAFTLTLIIGLLFGLIAENIGIHFVIGAYMAGLFVKEELVSDKIFQKIEDRLFGLSYSFLGPIFFVTLGFSVDFAAFADPSTLAFLIAVLPWPQLLERSLELESWPNCLERANQEAAVIGFAMNGRGAVELILASLGLSAGIISQEIFSILVFMAFFTTFITPLALKLVIPKEKETVAA